MSINTIDTVTAIILTWKPWWGKSVIAKEIAEIFSQTQHLNIWDLIRNNKKNTQLQWVLLDKKAFEALMHQYISTITKRILIIDSAKSMDQLNYFVKRFKNNYIIYFDVSDKISLERIQKRSSENRTDDKPWIIEKRIQRYNNTMKENIDFMLNDKTTSINKIDANLSFNEVKSQCISIINWLFS